MTNVLAQITAVATAIIAIALIVLAAVAIPLAGHFRRAYSKIDRLLDRVYGDITPIMHSVRNIGDNVNYVTTALRADVERVNDTINEANDKVQQAVAVTEQRMNEFNALLSVVQEEAEHLFLSTASTVRGVRHGAVAFRDGGGMDLASDELDAADPAADTALQEEGNGHDRNPQPAATALSAAPRVRPRPGTRRRGRA
jgi:uncharacterized protein YoxC